VLILKIKLVCHVSFVLVLSCLATAHVPCRPTILPKATLFTNWPQYRFDAGHTRCTPYETTFSTATVGGLALDWMYRAFAQVFGDPVIANGLVYFTSLSPDQTLYAVNATTGALVWNYTGGQAGFSPPVVANGVVYLGSVDHHVYAFNASTGTLLWQYETADVVVSAPTVANGVLYAGDRSGILYAFNASTGAPLWT